MSEIESNLRTEIIETLQTNRPRLSYESARGYTSLLINLLKKHVRLPMDMYSFYEGVKEIIAFHNTNGNAQTNKTRLAALYVLTEIPEYREHMMLLRDKVEAEYNEQKLNPKQAANRITFKQVKDKVTDLKGALKESETEENFVNYILMSFMSGKHKNLEPRRNEYATVKLNDYDVKKDNYLLKNTIVFNTYKTSKDHGQQIVTIPPTLMKTIKAWLLINKSNYLLPHNGKKMSSSQMSKRFHKIFGGMIVGADELRSIYLSNMHKNTPSLKDMQETAKRMGHSVKTAMKVYVKKN